jgi:hypothetical protein
MNMDGEQSSRLSIKSILFFVVIFGLIIYTYYHYERLMTITSFSIVRVLLIVMAGLSVAFPHIMNYLKYYDGDKYTLEDVMKAYHK